MFKRVLIDSSIWSSLLRRSKKYIDPNYKHIFQTLSGEGRIVIIGNIRQEVLSGISEKMQFEKLKNILSYFPDHKIRTEEYELAAEFFNDCRKQGIQGSQIDFLISAVAANNNFLLWTADNDFRNYSKVCPIDLLEA